MEKRQEKVVELIRNQTNYTNDEIIEKLKLWNNDYLSIIKEYLNPNFQKKKCTKKKTVNQQMMTEIRVFMDNVNTGYDKRVAKKREEDREAYLKELESTIKNAKIELKNLKSN